jgi:uncharacterized membrane protein
MMTVLRFALPALCLVGVAACAYASARLVGWVPPGKLPLYPSWVATHFATATIFAVIVPLQFWRSLRARRPAVHRALGRAAVACGAAMAVSGLATVYAVPDRPVSETIFMTAIFAAYAAFLALGVRDALARDIAGHRAWMARMVATGLGAVTQRLVFPPLAAAVGIDGRETFWHVFVSAAWIAWSLNMTVAEVWIRGGLRPRRPLAA